MARHGMRDTSMIRACDWDDTRPVFAATAARHIWRLGKMGPAFVFCFSERVVSLVASMAEAVLVVDCLDRFECPPPSF